MRPRGIRNNNPLNIVDNPNNAWIGRVGRDGKFVKFSAPEYGIRAAFKILNSYANRGITTLSSIINEWAPPSDKNPTTDYVAFVSRQTCIAPNSVVTPAMRAALLGAMANYENGAPISQTLIRKGEALV